MNVFPVGEPMEISRLRPKEQAGSKVRCHLLTHGDPGVVADRLNGLISPWGLLTPGKDVWMPCGVQDTAEAELGSAEALIPDKSFRDSLVTWWLSVPQGAKTPNWDIAATCSVQGTDGLLLVEAKAHKEELSKEEAGKRLNSPVSTNGRRNHTHIAACMQEANLALSKETGLTWSLSRDRNYQMSNRFAWAWRLLSLGKPVILIYLGFLDAEEMSRRGKSTLRDHEDWASLVRAHGGSIVPEQIWNRLWTVHGTPFLPLIRSIAVRVPRTMGVTNA